MKPLHPMDSATHAAAFGAAALIASQVASKAVRDAFFLSQFDVTALPVMVILSSALSIVGGVLAARLMSTLTPGRFLPLAFVFSSIFLFAEWGIAKWNEGAAAVLIYLHIATMGSLLISGFWSLLGDRFDPRTAKRRFGQIVAASTAGGVIGGLVAERLGSSLGIASVLPVLAFLHLLCAWIAVSLSPDRVAVARRTARSMRTKGSSLSVLRTVPYVRHLALLILFSTLGAGLLDYVFKTRAVQAFHDGSDLVRFFALFYTVTGIGTFLLQLIFSRVTLDKVGITGAVATLPLSLTIGSVASLFFPGLSLASLARGGEATVRSSLFKSGYEMLYAAVPRRERRATKSILDVGVERLGDLLGALLLGTIAWIGAGDSAVIAMVFSAAFGIAGLWVSRWLRRGYVQALENSLRSQSMPSQSSRKFSVYAGILRTFLWKPEPRDAKEAGSTPAAAAPVARDPILKKIAALQSPDSALVRSILHEPLPPVLVPHVIGMLAWDEVADDAIQALKTLGPRITGQLVDALLDPDQEFAVRRRIPRVLTDVGSQRAVDGLAAGLSDTRFEVRFHCAQALTQISARDPKFEISQEAILKAVEREFEAGPEVWRHLRVLDERSGSSEGGLVVEHIFRLLGLVYPREPLQMAYKALRSSDDYLRRTSLEYLEQILPLGLWQRILPLVDAGEVAVLN
jgi:ATP:ADP antiporter, AAA family